MHRRAEKMYQNQKNNNPQMRMNVKVNRNPSMDARESNKKKLMYQMVQFYKEVRKYEEEKKMAQNQ